MEHQSVQIAPYWNWNCGKCLECVAQLQSSNCTLLELKQTWISEEHPKYIPFKLHLTGIETSLTCGVITLFPVQIAPYWNWNRKRGLSRIASAGSNCTLLELKLFKRTTITEQVTVQIAPYWNWNSLSSPDSGQAVGVQIAPYWNWNVDPAVPASE